VLHLREDRALAVLRRAHLRGITGARHATAAAGTVIGQTPAPRTRVSRGSTVHVTISRGPAPVQVLDVVQSSVGDAERTLRRLGLHPAVHYVAAPGTSPGTVVGQTPASGLRPRGSAVALSVAEVPQWRTVRAFDGRSSGPVKIIGRQWRIVYRMAFHGTCTWVFFCSGPTARVLDATTGRYVAGFGLQDGTGQVRGFHTGAGTYEIQVTPGADDAGWSLQVQDLN
jgi:hypothetical protein